MKIDACNSKCMVLSKVYLSVENELKYSNCTYWTNIITKALDYTFEGIQVGIDLY